MSKKLNSMPSYTANLPHQAHDVSQSTAYTTCPGMLSPVYHDMLHVGDKIHFSASEFVRLNPLESQPLGKIDVHLDYFFVPLSVMYTPATSMFYQTDDLFSSVFSVSGDFEVDSFPTYDFASLFDYLKPLNGMLNPNVTNSCVFTNNYLIGQIFYPSNVFDCFGKSVYRIWDFLDMSPDCLLDAIGGVKDGDNHTIKDFYPSYTPWFALAYQAIYQLYFRNDDREPKIYHYNIDNFGVNGYHIIESPNKQKSIFQINYASRPKDYFNSVKVSPMFSSISMLNAPDNVFHSVNNWINNAAFQPSDSDGIGRIGNPFNTPIITQTNDSNVDRVSSSNIRQLFMVDKLLRVIGRAEKNYESQFLAHYGIKIPHDSLHNITHIGHDMMTITPEAVISQANTYDGQNGSALGEIGGKGTGMLSGRKHHFEAPFHGVFMVISHIIPRQRYVSGLNKLHMLNKITDFYQPEFDKKGMQPLFDYEVLFDMMFNINPNIDISSRVGWQFAYEQFKRKYDRVTRAFCPVSWNNGVNTYSPWVISSIPFAQTSSNDGYNYPRFFVDNRLLVGTDLLVNPTMLNVNMIQPYNTAWVTQSVGVSTDLHKPWLLYQTDPFICDFNLYIKKVNIMSEYGEPEL